MGIKPTSGNHVVIPPDNTQSRWGEWEAELDDKGEVAGEFFRKRGLWQTPLTKGLTF